MAIPLTKPVVKQKCQLCDGDLKSRNEKDEKLCLVCARELDRLMQEC